MCTTPCGKATENPNLTGCKESLVMKTYHFAAVIEKDENGYFAYCPELQGCYTSGETFETARANLADAIRLHVEDILAAGETIKTSESVNLTTVEVAV